MNYIIKKAGALTLEEQTVLGIVGIPSDWPINIYPYEDSVPDSFELVSDVELEALRVNSQAAYDAWLQSLRPVQAAPVVAPTEVIISASSAPIDSNPFAVPTYRTKRSATTALMTVAAGEAGNLDFLITEERYASGGLLLVKNAEFGDYATASVYDKDEVIPLAYRALLCEAHPIVSTYIEKEWVKASNSVLSTHEINTYPLNAKITAGLYLRITYYATSTGESRIVGANYYLTKKL